MSQNILNFCENRVVLSLSVFDSQQHTLAQCNRVKSRRKTRVNVGSLITHTWRSANKCKKDFARVTGK